jgi:transcriptional regulator with XRE-family HTH domain
LNRIENGHLMPTAPVIEHLAEALNVAPGALFEEAVLAGPKADPPDPGQPEVKGPSVWPVPHALSLVALSPEQLETRLFGAPAVEGGELAPALTIEEAHRLVRALRTERDALEDWVEAYGIAPPEDRLRTRREYVRAKEHLAWARLYYLVLLDYWSKLADPRGVPFKGVRQIASESKEAQGLMQAIRDYQDELRQIAYGDAGQVG